MIKVEDVAYVRFSAPDLPRMEQFLTVFGMMRADSNDPDQLFMRGSSESPVLHITEVGEPRFVALGLKASSIEDLQSLAKSESAPVEPLAAPGGGWVVRLRDPDSNVIELVAGQTPARRVELAGRTPWNDAYGRARIGEFRRTGTGAASVIRLGHCVLNVSDFRTSERWYKARFGFLTSDEIAVAPEVSIGAFLRCDRGAIPADHHTIALVQSPKGPGFNHAAFEVCDLDDLMRGHKHLKDAGAKPEWGVGRHFLGSQVFDYWRDPYGFTLEHWTDGDLLTAQAEPQIASIEQALGVQWGPPMPPSFA